ncbi:MAG: hypothetical protein J2P16_02095 [Mycobacterium sp.]|nr:hypothetical protein [Mycobacterium sp.]
MQRALQPYITAGVALAGASLIATAPMAPYLPDVQVRAVQLTADSVFDPFTTLQDVLTTAFANIQALNAEIAADPFPVLTQISANQMAYGETLTTALQGVGSALNTELTTALPQAFQQASQEIAAGNIPAAAQTLNEALTLFVLAPGLPLLESGALNIPQEIAQNWANAFQALTGFGTLIPIISGLIGPPEATIAALGDSAQAIVTAVNAGDFQTALSDLANTPATILGAYLNGFTASFGQGYPGFLSPDSEFSFGPGTLQAFLVDIPQIVAAAITPSASATAAAALPDPLTGILDGLFTGQGLDLSGLAADLTSLLGGGGLSADLGGFFTDLLNLF